MKTRIIFLFILLLMVNIALIAQAPEWLWAAQAGGSSTEAGSGIITDNAGSIYVTGSFYSTATFGSYSITSAGGFDIFVAKMDATGNWLWAVSAGASEWDFGCEITVDATGNSYVTGNFQGTATFGSYSITSAGDDDIFVAKMGNSGNWLWVTQAGGTDGDGGVGITIDDTGNSYVTGRFQGTAIFGSFTQTSSGADDIFVARWMQMETVNGLQKQEEVVGIMDLKSQ